MLHALLVSVLLVAITVAFGWLLYDADVPTGAIWPGSWRCSPSARRASAPSASPSPPSFPTPTRPRPIVNATILPLLFLSGIFIPIGDNAPGWLTWTARIFPVKHFADGIQAGFVGTTFHWYDVLVVAAWGTGRGAARHALLQLGAANLSGLGAASRRIRRGW